MRKRISKLISTMPAAWKGSRGITGLETAIVLIAFVVVSSVFAFAALSTGLFSSDKSKETINAGLAEASGTLEVRGSLIMTSLAVTNETVINTAGATTGTIANIAVVNGSEKLVRTPGNTTLTRVTSSPTTNQYTINYTTGLVTLGGPAISNPNSTGDAVTGDYSAQIIDQATLQVANAAGGQAVDLTPGKTLITYFDAGQMVNIATADVTVTALGNADTDKLVEPGEMYEIKLSGLKAGLNPDLKTDTPFVIQIKPAIGAVLQIARRTPVLLDKVNDLG